MIFPWVTRRRGGSTAGKPPFFDRATLWIDPQDASSLTLENARLFNGTSEYFTTADSNDFTGGSPTQMSWRWRVNRRATKAANGGVTDRCFMSHWNYSAQGGWAVTEGDLNDGNNDVRLWIATQDAAGGERTITTSNQAAFGAFYSEAVVTFDGSQASDSNKVRIYLDGVLVNPANYVIGGGALPTAFRNPSCSLDIGRFQGLNRWYNGAMKDVAFWNGKVLSATEVATLYNAGTGIPSSGIAAAIGSTGLMLALDLTEASGAAVDSSPFARSVTVGAGTIARTQIVRALRDKSPSGLVWPMALCHGFTYLPTGINSKPALFQPNTGNNNYSQISVANWNRFSGVEQDFFVISNEATGVGVGGEVGHLGSTKNADNNTYIFTGLKNQGGTYFMGLRIRDNASPNDTLYGSTAITLGTSHYHHWNLRGSGGSSSYRAWLDGVAQTITSLGGFLAGDVNKTWANVPISGNDRHMLGGFPTGVLNQGAYNTTFGGWLMMRGLDDKERLSLQRWIKEYGGF